MSSPGSDGKKRKRALEELRRGFSRRSAELVCGGLLALDEREREPYLEAAAALVVAEVAGARASGAWSRLVPWAKRVEIEPRLATVLGEAQGNELRWALVWGCAFSGEWARAERFWRELTAPAAGAGPAGPAPLVEAMDAWIGARGSPSPPPPLLEQFALPEPDARLGIEPVGPRRRITDVPPPEEVGQVESAVVAARCALGFEAFPLWAVAALDGRDEVLASAVGEAASALALRDALVRLETGGRDPLAPLTLVAACVDRGRAPSARALLGLRLALQGLRDPAFGPPRVAVLTSLVRACMRDAALAPLVGDALTLLASEADARPEATDGVLAALGAAAESFAAPEAGAQPAPGADRAAGAALWAAGAVLAWRGQTRSRPRSTAIPPWLDLRAESMIGDGRELTTWLAGADARSRQSVLHFAAERASEEAAVRIVLAAAALGGDRVRSEVGRCVEELLDRLSSRPFPWSEFEHVFEGPNADGLSPAAARVWERIEDAVLVLSPRCMRIALRRAPSPRARDRILDRYTAEARSAAQWIDAIAAARRRRLRKAPQALLERLIERYRHDPAELASAFDEALQRAPGRAILAPLARALVEAVEAHSGASAPHVSAAVKHARHLLDRPEPAVAPRRRRAARKTVREETLFDLVGGTRGGE